MEKDFVMDWIASVVTNQTGALVASFFFIVGVVLVLTGKLSFNGKGVRLGIEKDVRETLRLQLELITSFVTSNGIAIAKKLGKEGDTDTAKYILSRVEDVFQKAIVLNHMTKQDSYIAAKVQEVKAALVKRGVDVTSVEEDIAELTKQLICMLLELKK